MTKAEYRAIYKNKRMQLSDEIRFTFDKNIYNQLLAIDLSAVQFLHIYIAIHKFKEPDTLSFISYLRKNYPKINLVTSISDFQNHSMINYIWDVHLILKENKWGILEPQGGTIIDEGKIDMVLIPLLVADVDGNRVGYGKGFYDRFLTKCKPKVTKIGISYFEPVDRIEDLGDWDVPLDLLITPSRSIYFK